MVVLPPPGRAARFFISDFVATALIWPPWATSGSRLFFDFPHQVTKKLRQVSGAVTKRKTNHNPKRTENSAWRAKCRNSTTLQNTATNTTMGSYRKMGNAPEKLKITSPELSRSSKNRDFQRDQNFTRSNQHVTVSVDAPRARKAQDVSTGRNGCATRISRGQSDTSRSQFEPPRMEMRKPDPQIRDPTFSGLLETFASTGRPGGP